MDYDAKIDELKIIAKRMVEESSCPIHNWSHVLRVLRNAKRIHKKEGGDWKIIEPAVYLHDCIRPVTGAIINDHATASAEAAKPVLKKLGFESAGEIYSCIYKHSSSSSKKPPRTVEERIVWDADKMDGFGVIGIARTLVLSGEKDWSVEKAADAWINEIERVGKTNINNIDLIMKKWMMTETGRKISLDDAVYFIDFFKKIKKESSL